MKSISEFWENSNICVIGAPAKWRREFYLKK